MMDVEKNLNSALVQKELELNALLEVTQAINNNVSEDDLFRIFRFILQANMDIERLALYVQEGAKWNCKQCFGTRDDFTTVELRDEWVELLNTENDPQKWAHTPFATFQHSMMVSHKERLLAMVFLKGSANTAFIQALANIIFVAIENKKLASRELAQKAMLMEVGIARDVQRLLFPADLPQTQRLRIGSWYLPFKEVGGDYFDYVPLNKKQFLVCIADVSGKGMPAALLMSNFQAALRTSLQWSPNLSKITEIMNQQVMQSAKGENFVTCAMAIYDHTLRTLVFVNAGHNPPLVYDRVKEKVIRIETGTTVLGAFDELPFVEEGMVEDLSSFLALFYTDGLVEVRNVSGEEYGQERLEVFMQRFGHQPEHAFKSALQREIDDFKQENSYHDDVTVLICEVNV